MRTQAPKVVNDLMTGDLIAVGPTDRAGRALNTLLQSGLHALPIIDSNSAPVGLITMADLVPLHHDIIVGEQFYGAPLTVDFMASVAEAASLMRREHVHHLIVTDGETAVGMLSSYDLIQILESKI